MTEPRRGPRNYKIFICHRYGDDHLYGALRHTLSTAKQFAWTNHSVQTDRPIRFRSDEGLKTSLTNKVKHADLMLVFAHSSGAWIEHEIDAAVRFGVPIIAVLDPARLGQPKTRSRMEKIAANALGEVRLDQPDRIIAAIRRYARPHGMPITERVSISRLALQPRDGSSGSVATPQDVARRTGARGTRAGGGGGLVARIGHFILGRAGRAATR